MPMTEESTQFFAIESITVNLCKVVIPGQHSLGNLASDK
ncbi:hypothetical protein V474_15840 [Novosphingobium barchaimii LL02]|uniref:Uncharacterized protein n=1 Tax=Novosphingobium barchaimii LL02 TaxID=1114963 RepID=A0A0J7XYQ9_9SPHN|nr:hypothetical protein V474_15840 [Novosphingobium barchaimii LL02]